MSRLREVSSEEFSEIINTSYYMVDVLEKLGYSRTSGTMTKYVKRRIKEENLSTAHFIGMKGRSGRGGKPRYTMEEILVENSRYYNNDSLKRRLLNRKMLEEKCDICGILPEWCGKPLTLQLDHINGVSNDHRLINLRLLCPNCHSQTITYSGRNRK